MNKYKMLSSINILQPIMHRLRQGAFEISSDHKIHLDDAIIPERPWIGTNIDPERECGKWLEIYFKYYALIPKGCRNCWKIVFKPDTVKELFMIKDLQKQMDHLPSKVGCETRAFTGNKGGYVAFWYATLDSGLKGARELHSLIDAKIQALLGREKKRTVNLKRGCTEMENYTLNNLDVGSSKWDEIAERMNMDKKEQLLDSLFVSPITVPVPVFCDINAEQQFIDFAFENGDLTYLEFTDNVPHMESLTFYEDSKHKNQNFKSTWIRKQEIKINYTCSCGVIFTVQKIKELDENNRWLPEKNICLCDCGKEIDITEIVKLRRKNGPNIDRPDDAENGLDRADSPIIQAIPD